MLGKSPAAFIKIVVDTTCSLYSSILSTNGIIDVFPLKEPNPSTSSSSAVISTAIVTITEEKLTIEQWNAVRDIVKNFKGRPHSKKGGPILNSALLMTCDDSLGLVGEGNNESDGPIGEKEEEVEAEEEETEMSEEFKRYHDEKVEILKRDYGEDESAFMTALTKTFWTFLKEGKKGE